MQLVFVHGVATRTTPRYKVELENRNQLFTQVAFKDRPLDIRSPMWGDEVPVPAWGGAAFPRLGKDKVASFSLQGLSAVARPGGAAGMSVASIAATDPAAAIDTVFAELVDAADREGRALTSDDIAQFQAVSMKLKGDGFSPALKATGTDTAFVKALRTEAGVAKSYGLLDPLKAAAMAVADRGRNLLADGVVALARDGINPLVGRFLGDIFVYLKDGDLRQRIRASIRPALLDAHAKRGQGEGLVLIGHSLGGVILYDMLTSDPDLDLPKDAVNLLVTVGSQPGFFEEMKLFEGDDLKLVAPIKVGGPAAVKSWLNVYDPVDFFGFRAEPIFEKAKDLTFNSVTGLLDAHTTYFKRPQFHARLQAHLDELTIA